MPQPLLSLGVEIDFANGASFAYPLILNDFDFGILDVNTLGDVPADIVDISDMVMQCSTRRGRNRILSNFEAGTATVVLNDPNADFNPQNTNSPYYGKLFPLRKIRIYANTELSGIPIKVFIFSGYITTFDTGFYQGTNATTTVTLQCVDGFRLLNNVAIDSVPLGVANQLSGTRIDTLLDTASFPTSLRSINSGQSTMQVDQGGNRQLLQAIQLIEQSEFGAFFMDREGQAKFLDRNTVSIRSNDFPIQYSDVGIGQGFSMIDLAYDDQNIINRITVSAANGIGTATVFDQESIDRFYIKSGLRSDLLFNTPSDALNQAQTILAARKDAKVRIDSMILNLKGVESELDLIIDLGLDIYTLIKVTKEMPDNSTVESELFVQGVTHDININTWVTKVFTAEPLIQAFILDGGPEQDPNAQGVLALMSPIPNTNALSY